MDTNAHADGIDATYAHPERLVTTAWLADRIAAGETGPGSDLVILESDEDVLLFETGHIPTAQKLDWHQDLNDPLTRDYVDAEQFARLMTERGIGRETQVVIYGDRAIGGRPMPSGCSPCSATRRQPCSTAGARSGSPRGAR